MGDPADPIEEWSKARKAGKSAVDPIEEWSAARKAKATPAIAEPIVGDNLNRLADYYEATLSEFSPDEVRAQFEKMDLVSPDKRMAAAQGAKQSVSKLEDFYSGAEKVAGLLSMRANTSYSEEDMGRAEQFRKTMEAHRRGGPGFLRKVGKTAGQATRATMEVIDTPFRAVRNLTGGVDPKTSETVDAEQWNKQIKAVPGIKTFSDVASAPIAAAVAPLAIAARTGGRALRNVSSFLDQGSAAEHWQKPAPEGGLGSLSEEASDAWKTFRSVQEDVGDTGRNILFDPLSWLSFGGAGEGKAVLGQSARFLRAAGVTGTKAEQALAEIGQIAKTADKGSMIADLQRGGAMVPREVFDAEQALAKATGSAVNPATKTPFGAAGELYGKSGPALTTPLGGNLQFADVASKLGLHKVARGLAHPLADAAVAISKPLKVFGGRKLASVDPLRKVAEVNTVRAMASRKELAAQYDKETAGLARSAHNAELNTDEAWAKLTNDTLDPDYETLTKQDAVKKQKMTPADFDAQSKFFHVDGQAEKRLLVPDPTYNPSTNLSPAKQDFIDEWAKVRRSRLKDLQDAGLDVKDAPNPVSGHNVPRKYETVKQLLEDTGPTQQGKGGATFMHHRDNEVAGVISDRVGGLPLGAKADARKGLKADRNLLNLQSGYDNAAARVITRQRLMDKLALEGIAQPAESASSRGMTRMGKWAVRPDIARLIDASLDPAGTSLASVLRSNGTVAGRMGAAMLDAGTKLANQWKMNGLILRPGYHVVNALNDMVYMHSLGVNNPAGRILTVDRVVRALEDGRSAGLKLRLSDGTELPWDDVIKLAQENNIGMGFLDRAGLSGQHKLKELERLSKGKDPRGLDITGRIGDASERLGSYARIGSFAERLVKLDPAAVAAKLTTTAHVDYETGGAATRIGGKIFPFIKFMSRSPKSLAQAAVMRPGTLNLVPHIGEGFQGEAKPGVEPRNYIFERGPAYRIPSYLEDSYSSLREFAGGTPIGKDESPYTLSRDPYIEPAMQILEPLSLNGPAAANMLWPHLRAPVEAMSEKDFLTRKPMRLEAGLNPNTPWWGGGAVGAIGGAQLGGWKGAALGGLLGSALAAGDWAEAGPGAQGALSRYGAGAMAPGAALLPLNWAIRNQQGVSMGQAATLGAMRDRDSRSTLPGDALAGQFGSTFTGFPTYVESPMGGLWNLANSPSMKKNQDMLAEIQKLLLGLKQAHLLQRQ